MPITIGFGLANGRNIEEFTRKTPCLSGQARNIDQAYRVPEVSGTQALRIRTLRSEGVRLAALVWLFEKAARGHGPLVL